MRFKPGDKIKVISDCVGTVLNDPVNSMQSILIDFNGQIARIPNDGLLFGLKSVRLVKVENDDDEQ